MSPAADTTVLCLSCDRREQVSFGDCLASGWPQCHGQTMRMLATSADVEAEVATAGAVAIRATLEQGLGPPEAGEVARMLVTSALAGRLEQDEWLLREAVAAGGIEAVLGALLATTTNMIGLLAIGYQCSPPEAWEIIQGARREAGAP